MPNDKQKKLLSHTLGGENPNTWYRNHFLAGENHHDYTDLCELEKDGFIRRGRTPDFCNKRDIVFHVTEKGKDLFR